MPETILVVDDEPDILDLVELTLVSEGYSVVAAKDGFEALESANAALPSLILLDLSMPGMDGFETLDALRREPRTAEIPVIMLTARAQISDKLRGISSGADDYITKPFDLNHLVDRVKSALARRVSREPAAKPLAEEWSGELEELAQHLETAAQIQTSLLPQSMPYVPGFRLAAMLQSSRVVSGDFYDFIPLEGGKLGVVVADIQGKGIPAALLMAMTRTALRFAAREAADPAQALKRVNDFLAVETEPDLFATMVYGALDPAARTFTYANGGHCHPILWSPSAGTARTLQTGGTIVGAFEDAEYESETAVLREGDILILYTDGVTEAENPSGGWYGEERLQALVRALSPLTQPRLYDMVGRGLEEFTGATQRDDDVTVVGIEAASEETTLRKVCGEPSGKDFP